MALTRKFLRELGIGDGMIDKIIDAHADTVRALKEERDTYRADAEKLSEIQGELDTLKAGDEGFKQKYDDLKREYDDFKTGIAERENHALKEEAYRAVLRAAGIKSRYIDTIIRAERHDIAGMKLNDGSLADVDALALAAQKNWAEFVESTFTQTAEVENPPRNDGGSSLTRDQIMAMRDPTERRTAIAKNLSLFEKGEND